MSQKSSLPQAAKAVSHVLMSDTRYFEVNCCIRVALIMAAGLGIGPEASRRINACR
jgi:hypothetical protein